MGLLITLYNLLTLYNGLLVLGWGLTFSSYSWRLAKIAFTLEDFHKKKVHPWRIHVPLKNFVKIKASPPKNSIFFYPAIEQIRNFYNLPLKNSMVPLPGSRGGGGVQMSNVIAQSVQLTWLHFVTDPPTLRSSSIAKCLGLKFSTAWFL